MSDVEELGVTGALVVIVVLAIALVVAYQKLTDARREVAYLKHRLGIPADANVLASALHAERRGQVAQTDRELFGDYGLLKPPEDQGPPSRQ